MKQTLLRVVRDPLAGFALVAVGIFGFDAVRPASEEPAERPAQRSAAAPAYALVDPELLDITISQDLVRSLEDEFEWLEGRQPDADESQLLVEEWLEDEIVFRHALLQGMHYNDAKLREHLIEKVRLLWTGSPQTPTDRQVLDYYMANIDRYYAEPRISFEQVYFEAPPPTPERILAELNEGVEIDGDGYWMGDDMDNYAASIIKTSFGGSFYKLLQETEPQVWTGPVRSPRGYHFVKVTGRVAAYPLAFADIHDRVVMDYEARQLLDQMAARTDAVRENFNITWQLDNE